MNINDNFYTLYNNGDTINENGSDNNKSKDCDTRNLCFYYFLESMEITS